MNPSSPNTETLNLAAIRSRLAGLRGRKYWRSLDQVAGTKAFEEFLHREFPVDASVWEDGVSRRAFLRLMGASFALAGLSACSNPVEKIVPYVTAPEEIVPGMKLFYATAMTLGGYATGLLVESHEGRPTKIEGNPQHPASLGATDAFAQASILSLYDPDRSQVVVNAGEISNWSTFFVALSDALAAQNAKQGAGLRILTETVSSPTLAAQFDSLFDKFPNAKWHQFEPLARDNVRAGAKLAFGSFVETQYHFDKADVVVSLDNDFLGSGPGWVRYAREFIDKRRVAGGQTAMNRLYAIESTLTTTGAMADHCRTTTAAEVELFARALAVELGVGTAPAGVDAKWVKAVAKDLQQHRGTSLVLAGDNQPPVVHALAHALNDALGNAGQTVSYTDSVAANPTLQFDSLRELVADMNAGKVDVLVIIGANPVFTAPVELDFLAALNKVKFRVQLAPTRDETTPWCHWHIPETHHLEAWSDARAFDGTATIMQPLIAPLYPAKSAHELMAALLGRPDANGHDIVRSFWKSNGLNSDDAWHAALHDGVVPGTAFAPKTVALQKIDVPAPSANVGGGLEINFRADPSVWDGRFANNGWLQELPRPLTKLTWDNVALIAPATAEKLALANGDVVELRQNGRAVQAPVWILPGQAANAVTVHVGYGRTAAGHAGTGVGFNAYSLRTAATAWFGAGLEVKKLGHKVALACTQDHHSMEDRELVRVANFSEYQKNPSFAKREEDGPQPSLLPGHKYPRYAWGMTIDLTACIGCNACTIACQAENNIPVVGKEQVATGRAMHWLRIDRYYEGGLDKPDVYFEPVLCMHCENAPCEIVCPVGATVHTDDGLNAMVYNRCVGTRYCSNNCPWKVRRFNFFQYSDTKTPQLKLMFNPEVTVRNRGVMEKCTFCVQRIEAAKIRAEKENRKVADGEFKTACQAVCPTNAFEFGDLNDPTSRVSKAKAQPLNYTTLAHLNAKPRTSYLARVRNPNPELEA